MSMNEFKRELGVKWIKAESGTTYLCPVGALGGIDNPTEDQIRAMGVDESHNPHND